MASRRGDGEAIGEADVLYPVAGRFACDRRGRRDETDSQRRERLDRCSQGVLVIGRSDERLRVVDERQQQIRASVDQLRDRGGRARVVRIAPIERRCHDARGDVPLVAYEVASLPMRMTSKGQVTIPLELRERFGLGPGAEVEVVAGEDGAVVRPAVARARGAEVVSRLRDRADGGLDAEAVLRLTRGDGD